MVNASTIIVICWAIFFLYWFINWKSVKPNQEVIFKQRSFQWIIFWILLLLFVVSRILLPGKDIHIFMALPNSLSVLLPIGTVMTFIGLLIAIIARKTLADNWSSDVVFKKDHKLITEGIYKYIRHPIYTGIIFMGIGTVFVLQSIFSIIFYSVMIIFFIYKLKKEEYIMIKHFPKEYPNYIKKTKTLIPFIY